MRGDWFWYGLTIACLLWYSLITLYVAVKGAQDIRTMFIELGRNARRQNDTLQIDNDANN
jgi:hypothetical protein